MTSRVATCEWCEADFIRPSRKGPAPRFCSQSHRQRAFELRRITNLKDALRAARAEIDRHGYGDFHYGDQPRDPGVLGALADIDRVLSKP